MISSGQKWVATLTTKLSLKNFCKSIRSHDCISAPTEFKLIPHVYMKFSMVFRIRHWAPTLCMIMYKKSRYPCFYYERERIKRLHCIPNMHTTSNCISSSLLYTMSSLVHFVCLPYAYGCDARFYS